MRNVKIEIKLSSHGDYVRLVERLTTLSIQHEATYVRSDKQTIVVISDHCDVESRVDALLQYEDLRCTKTPFTVTPSKHPSPVCFLREKRAA